MLTKLSLGKQRGKKVTIIVRMSILNVIKCIITCYFSIQIKKTKTGVWNCYTVFMFILTINLNNVKKKNIQRNITWSIRYTQRENIKLCVYF